MSSYAKMLEAMDAGTLSPQEFDHRAHVGVAFEALRQGDFFSASKRVADGLTRLTVAAGVPEKFHATITQTYMSAIAQAMHDTPANDAETFLLENPDILAGGFLRTLYSKERLSSDLARTTVVLPDRLTP